MLRLGCSLLMMMMIVAGCGNGGEESPPEQVSVSEDDFIGRWDVTVETAEGNYPTWFALERGDEGLTGDFVGRVGSARPIQDLEIAGNEIQLRLPVQYESHSEDLAFQGRLEDGQLVGTTQVEDGTELAWTAVRAPRFDANAEPEWGEPINLIQENLEGWRVREADQPNNWVVEDGILRNKEKGTDLITENEWMDFKLHAEFRYPEGSNSGIYLRGRYEIQIQDDFGKEPSNVYIGGVYGFLTPSKNAALQAGEWQTYDISLVGRTITIVLNGEAIIESQEIPGITGGALDSSEGEPGPIMLQGDHGPIFFRNLTLTPAVGSQGSAGETD